MKRTMKCMLYPLLGSLLVATLPFGSVLHAR